jgi:hypothetical protein
VRAHRECSTRWEGHLAPPCPLSHAFIMSWPCICALWVVVCACLPRVWSILLRRSHTRRANTCKTHANTRKHTHTVSAPLGRKDTSHHYAFLATRSSCHGQASVHFGWLSVRAFIVCCPAFCGVLTHAMQTHAKPMQNTCKHTHADHGFF